MVYDDHPSDKDTGGTSISGSDSRISLLLQNHIELIQKRRKLPKIQTVTYPGLELHTSCYSGATIGSYAQQFPDQQYFDYYASKNAPPPSYPTIYTQAQPKTQTLLEDDQEEDMDMSD
jgi:hypothetical protein